VVLRIQVALGVWCVGGKDGLVRKRLKQGNQSLYRKGLETHAKEVDSRFCQPKPKIEVK
jgi:hypothetical protein